MRIRLLIAMSVLVAGLFAIRTDAARILVVDPADTEAGELCADALPGQVTRITSPSQIAANEKWDAVVWFRPQPLLYAGNYLHLWNKVLADPSAGLMIVGLPHDQAAQAALFDALKSRGRLRVDRHLRTQWEGCYWIWDSDEPKLNERKYLRKTFTVSQIPPSALLYATADNVGRIWLNGQEVLRTNDWKFPTHAEVVRLLRAGDNVLAAEVVNADGPGGLALSLLAQDEQGRTLLDVRSDRSWKIQTSSVDHWTDIGFDDTGWHSATELNRVGEGVWGQNIWEDFSPLEFTLHRADRQGTLFGRVVLRDILKVDGKAAALVNAGKTPVAMALEGTGGKLVVFAADLEKTLTRDEAEDIFSNGQYAGLIRQSVGYLLGEAVDAPAAPPAARVRPSVPANAFAVVMQLTPLPRVGVPLGTLPRARGELRRMVDELIEHGCTSLYVPLHLPEELARDVEEYAQDRGMSITVEANNTEPFDRNAPPAVCIYTPEYRKLIDQRVAELGRRLGRYRHLLGAFVYQDEPFHAGEASFGYTDPVKREFRRRYGYDLPATLEAAGHDPRQFLDVLNFRSGNFPEGWQPIYEQIKKTIPQCNVILTHDSHNTFGGGVGQETKIAIDDVFHWGGSFTDIFAFDIYPYMMNDFRYGPNSALKKPRMSQAIYAFAQMRNLTAAYGRKLAFWFGTFNHAWFKLTDERRNRIWQERAMCYTAIGQGTDILVAGYGVPEEAGHWEELGKGLRVIQKAAPRLIHTRPMRAKAAFLFPRTQYLQTQEEYWNVAMSFELIRRAFGELDVIHEEQVADGRLKDYSMLVMCDVKLLPREVMRKVAEFVHAGGVVLADGVPVMDEVKRPMKEGLELFGIRRASSERINWLDEAGVRRIDGRVSGEAFGQPYDFHTRSPRIGEPGTAVILLSDSSGKPAMLKSSAGKGKVYLMNFCLQDTYFAAWEKNDPQTRSQLRQLIGAICTDAGLTAHVRADNPEVIAAVRTGGSDVFLVVACHETTEPNTTIYLADLPLVPTKAVNMENDRPVVIRKTASGMELQLQTPPGATYLIDLQP